MQHGHLFKHWIMLLDLIKPPLSSLVRDGTPDPSAILIRQLHTREPRSHHRWRYNCTLFIDRWEKRNSTQSIQRAVRIVIVLSACKSEARKLQIFCDEDCFLAHYNLICRVQIHHVPISIQDGWHRRRHLSEAACDCSCRKEVERRWGSDNFAGSMMTSSTSSCSSCFMCAVSSMGGFCSPSPRVLSRSLLELLRLVWDELSSVFLQLRT
jgi:hypothetical protein